jgi:hypothetical protein
MDKGTFTTKDWELILESLKYTRLKFEEYDKYPSIEFKQKRIEEVNHLISKINTFLKSNN